MNRQQHSLPLEMLFYLATRNKSSTGPLTQNKHSTVKQTPVRQAVATLVKTLCINISCQLTEFVW